MSSAEFDEVNMQGRETITSDNVARVEARYKSLHPRQEESEQLIAGLFQFLVDGLTEIHDATSFPMALYDRKNIVNKGEMIQVLRRMRANLMSLIEKRGEGSSMRPSPDFWRSRFVNNLPSLFQRLSNEMNRVDSLFQA